MTHWTVYFPELLGSDALMYVDGRRSFQTAACEVIETVSKKKKVLLKFASVSYAMMGKGLRLDTIEKSGRRININQF